MNGMESTLGHNDQPGSEGSGPAVSEGRKASAGSLLVRVGNAFVSWLKEGTTTVIALAVVAVALWMLGKAFLD